MKNNKALQHLQIALREMGSEFSEAKQFVRRAMESVNKATKKKTAMAIELERVNQEAIERNKRWNEMLLANAKKYLEQQAEKE